MVPAPFADFFAIAFSPISVRMKGQWYLCKSTALSPLSGAPTLEGGIFLSKFVNACDFAYSRQREGAKLVPLAGLGFPLAPKLGSASQATPGPSEPFAENA